MNIILLQVKLIYSMTHCFINYLHPLLPSNIHIHKTHQGVKLHSSDSLDGLPGMRFDM